MSGVSRVACLLLAAGCVLMGAVYSLRLSGEQWQVFVLGWFGMWFVFKAVT